MKIDPQDYRVHPGHDVKLKKWPTRIKPLFSSPKHYRRALAEDVAQMRLRQSVLAASGRYAILVIFQAMDAAGKDGAISHVMSGVNPQGCEVFSFKVPSAEELRHDFLWRATCRLPERGRIGIFNRSYYEEVLIARVHPPILKNESLPDELLDPRKIWRRRFRSIVNLEHHLHRNGTRVIKFFLHLSKEEQARRFLERIEQPEKNWKLSLSDLAERKKWKLYLRAYEACLGATATAAAPWFIVPADDKDDARLIVSRIIVGELDRLKMSYPRPDEARRRELKLLRHHLKKEIHEK